MRLGAGAERLLLLLGDGIGRLLAQFARDVGALVLLERVGLIEPVKTARAEVFERVAAVDMLPIQTLVPHLA